MEREHIKDLLEKYWKGETSLEQEQELKSFFVRDDVPEEWQNDAQYFKYLDLQQERIALDDSEILAMLEGVKPETDKKTKTIPVRMWLENAIKVAAVVFIVASAAFFVRQDYESRKDQMDPVIADTFEDPQKAFEETKKALMLVSQQFGKGKKHAQKIKMLDEATDKVQQL